MGNLRNAVRQGKNPTEEVESGKLVIQSPRIATMRGDGIINVRNPPLFLLPRRYDKVQPWLWSSILL